MSHQNEITISGNLLDEKGRLINTGWARRPLLKYNRENIASGWWRVKEWDYYAVLNEKYGITFTLTDLGLMGLYNITWLDFQKPKFTVGEELKLLTRGRTGLPKSSQIGDVHFSGKHVSLKFLRGEKERRLVFQDSEFDGGKGLRGEIVLTQPEDLESIVMATPWKDKPGKFYYNQKINCLPAKGHVQIGDEVFLFRPDLDFGVLDWGRGVWPYSDTWYWGSASGIQGGKCVGFNIGYGFGDLSTATENIFFVNGRGHKLDRVTFHYDPEDYLRPWTFSSNDGRFEMEMEPILDRNAVVNLLIFKSVQHQVFGKFSGYVILDNGDKFEIKEQLGFAERVNNRW